MEVCTKCSGSRAGAQWTGGVKLRKVLVKVTDLLGPGK